MLSFFPVFFAWEWGNAVPSLFCKRHLEDIISAGFLNKFVKQRCSLPVSILFFLTLSLSFFIIPSSPAASDELDSTNQQIGGLENQSQQLDQNYRQALTDLVSVDSKVNHYSSEIGSVQQRQVQVEAEVQAQQSRLAQVKQELADRQAVLAQRLRGTYKSDNSNYLGVVMDSENFSEFLNRVDAINKIAESDQQLINSINDAKKSVEDNLGSLSANEQELNSLVQNLSSARQGLVTARQQQQSVVDTIQGRKQANDAQLAQLQSQAASIEAKMSQQQAQAAAAASNAAGNAAGDGGSAAGNYSPPPATGASITVVATAYCMAGSTATGMPAGPGIIAVDPNVIPLGSRVHVSGYGDAIAADTGGAIVGNRIDVWLPCSQAYAWGTRTVTVTIY